MALLELELPLDDRPLPARVQEFLEEADQRNGEFADGRPSFVPCDAEAAYRALLGLRESDEIAGLRMCEWGSGLGVVAGLASMLGFDAHAIEIDGELSAAGRRLTEEFSLDVEHVPGSFVPPASQDLAAHAGGELDWLQPGGADAYELLGRDPDEFDVVFAYPWPGEESVIEELFARHAGAGAVLLTYHGLEGLRVRRAVGWNE